MRLTASLYAHQDAGARWLVERRRAIVADDMGLGKTREALAAALAFGHRIVVVGPAGLRVNWLREAEAVGAQIEYWSWAKVPTPPECRYTLIADEAHYAQNFKAQRTKRFLALAEAAEAVFPLTGTPIKNGRPANLYPLLVAVRHEIARDRRAYEVRYCAAGPTRWSPWDATGAAHLEELHAKIADSLLRRTKDECLDLPAKTRVLRTAELAPDAQALYSRALGEMQVEYRRRLAAGEISAADALVLLTHVMHAGSLAKVDAACEIAEEVLEQGGQVVLYFRFVDSARARVLLVEVLGAEALRRFYLDMHRTYRNSVLYPLKSPDSTEKQRPAASRANAAVESLSRDPGNIGLRVPGYGFMKINDMQARHLQAVQEGYGQQAEAMASRKKWWGRLLHETADRLGDRRTFGKAFSLAERKRLLQGVPEALD